MNLPNMSSLITSATSILGANAAGANPLLQQVIEQVAVGAMASGALAALAHPDVKAAMLPFDPLGLASKPIVPPAPGAAAPVAAAPAAVKVLTMAEVLALGTTVAGAQAAGYIVAG